MHGGRYEAGGGIDHHNMADDRDKDASLTHSQRSGRGLQRHSYPSANEDLESHKFMPLRLISRQGYVCPSFGSSQYNREGS